VKGRFLERAGRPARAAHGLRRRPCDERQFVLPRLRSFRVWQLFSDGRAAKNLTAGFGLANKTTLRVQRIEPIEDDDEERGIDPGEAASCCAAKVRRRARRDFFRTTFAASGAPDKLLWGDKNFRYAPRAGGGRVARDGGALRYVPRRLHDEFNPFARR